MIMDQGVIYLQKQIFYYERQQESLEEAGHSIPLQQVPDSHRG
jgi:hypothetical protein